MTDIMLESALFVRFCLFAKCYQRQRTIFIFIQPRQNSELEITKFFIKWNFFS